MVQSGEPVTALIFNPDCNLSTQFFLLSPYLFTQSSMESEVYWALHSELGWGADSIWATKSFQQLESGHSFTQVSIHNPLCNCQAGKSRRYPGQLRVRFQAEPCLYLVLVSRRKRTRQRGRRLQQPRVLPKEWKVTVGSRRKVTTQDGTARVKTERKVPEARNRKVE